MATVLNPPNTCHNCDSKTWHCLGCKKEVSLEEFTNNKADVAMSCNCCDHNFVCRACYDAKPGYDAWKPEFGSDHSVTDHVSGDSGIMRLLMALLGGRAGSGTSVPGAPNVRVYSTTDF